MTSPHPHRRSYGFGGSPTDRQETVKETRPPAPPHKKMPTPKKSRPEGDGFAKLWAVLGWLLWAFWVTVRTIVGWTISTTRFLWNSGPGREARQYTRENFGRVVLGSIVVGTLLVVGVVAWVSRDLPDPNKLTDRKVDQSTKIYDRTGEHLLYEVFTDQKRTLVPIDSLPKNLINGVIATEDTTFYQHHGVRPLSILRAIVVGMIPGHRIESTSTLTQQLVKNAILTNERSLTRKLKEIILSIRLEQKYTKDQILQIYFNEIPYGSTNYGVESAAQSYFGKDAKDLNLAESATLAGIPKAPSTYLNNPALLKQRRDFVLRRMFEEGYITEGEKVAAQAEPLTLDRKLDNIKAPHFVMYVRDQLTKKFDENMIDTGGLKVITTLDWEKQQAAEKAVDEVGGPLLTAAKGNNMALVAEDPRSGQILAMVGSKDFSDNSIDGQFNVATQGKRQPGSSFKPIIYAAAFEKGYTPDTVLYDVETNFAVSGPPYIPKNYDGKEHGPVTMRDALQRSLNIPAVQTLYLVGAKQGVDFAKRMGYTTFEEGEFGLTLVLGGGEVNLLEHVGAYGIFANNGIKEETTSILKVEDANGETLYEWKPTEGATILAPEVTATITNVLSDDAARSSVFGAGGVLTLPGRPVAAKTGTTNNYVDAWTMGYTPSLVAGVWAGNTNNTPLRGGDGGSKVAAPVWHAFMQEALKNTAPESFPDLPPNTATKPVLRGSSGGTITLKINKTTGRIATSSTPPDLIEERSYLQPHSILHYVTKDDPRGPVPEHPEEDPQYTIWENAITDWVRRKKIEDPTWNVVFTDAPQDVDSENSLGMAPTLQITSPAPNASFTSRRIVATVSVSAPRGVARVTYLLDGRQVSSITTPPFALSYYAQGLAPGEHTLTARAEDDQGNRSEQSTPFTLSAGEDTANVQWNTRSGVIKAGSSFPYPLFLSPYRLNDIASVVIVGSRNGGSTETIASISDLANLFNGMVATTWTSAQTGDWTLTAIANLKNGSTVPSEPISLRVE